MKRTDFRSILGLTDAENWGFGPRDLKRMKTLQPDGCLVATDDDEPVGFTIAISYGRNLGWIGNVVVGRGHRGAGIGSALVQYAVRYLLQRRVKRIGLLSYPENEGMYKRLGFETTNVFTTLSLQSGEHKSARATERIPFCKILRLDKRAFGADRSRLLRQLYREFPKSWVWISDHDRVSGYSLVTQYQDSSEVGPLVCEQMDEECVGTLLRSSIARTEKWPLNVSVPVSSPRVTETAESLGFRLEKKGVAMSYAQLQPTVIGPSIGALGFLDKG
jgi:GNAT superfamily N-acetyltransferase